MSEEDGLSVDSGDTRLLTAEYKDGRLQIVQVTPFSEKQQVEETESILPDSISEDDQQKFMQVLNPDKGLVQLDLLNLTLVRCEDGEESYRLVTAAEADGGELTTDGTVTCVLQSSDGEEHDGDDYVMVEGDNGPLVLLQSAAASSSSSISSPAPSLRRLAPSPEKKKEKQVSSAEILDKMIALKKAKALLATQTLRPGRRGRRRAGDIPPPHELLSSPHFKLFLYSCKLCNFKCNAIKELQAHRAAIHSSGAKTRGGGSRGGCIMLQCARCPYRGASNTQLMKHVQAQHKDIDATIVTTTAGNKISLDSKEVEEADVLVCGACGFESAARQAFIRHIETEHGATTC